MLILFYHFDNAAIIIVRVSSFLFQNKQSLCGCIVFPLYPASMCNLPVSRSSILILSTRLSSKKPDNSQFCTIVIRFYYTRSFPSALHCERKHFCLIHQLTALRLFYSNPRTIMLSEKSNSNTGV